MFMQIVQSKKTSSTVYLLNINHVTKLFLSHVNHVRRVFHFHLKTNKTLEVATKPLKNFKKWQTTPNWRFFSSYKVSGLDYVVWSIHCAEDTKSEYNRFVISCFQEQKMIVKQLAKLSDETMTHTLHDSCWCFVTS